MPARAFLVALLTIVALVLTVPAGAAVTCTFDDPTGTVTISLANGDLAVVSRSTDAIAVNGTPCDAATVTNVDTITVDSAGTAAELDIDLSGGPFAPGETAEADTADSEIEWIVDLQSGSTLKILGSTGDDAIVLGASGVNLNAVEATADVDVVITGAPTIVIQGADGADVLSVDGDAATGAAGPIATVTAGPGDDELVAGAVGSTFDGGDGVDDIDYSDLAGPIDADMSTGHVAVDAASDTIANIENLTATPGDDHIVGDAAANTIRAGAGNDIVAGGAGDDSLDGGDGTDALGFDGAANANVDLAEGVAIADGTDAIEAFEDVTGTDGDDHLVGDDGANTLTGLGGNDTISGGEGADALKGGLGKDTLRYVGARHGVTVDLRDGTASGLGADTLAGFENVEGSGKADVIHGDGHQNDIDGRTGGDELYGHGGGDHLAGSDGNDLLTGQKGDDLILGGGGNDQLDGGQGDRDVCRGGDGADSFVDCDNLPTSLAGVWVSERVGSTLR